MKDGKKFNGKECGIIPPINAVLMSSGSTILAIFVLFSRGVFVQLLSDFLEPSPFSWIKRE